MKIITIIENKSKRETLIAQYGLSLLVEANGKRILVDVGQDEATYTNFLALNLDPSTIDAIVLSHNHFDHVGGLHSFLEVTGNAPVYASHAADNTELYTKKPFRKKKLASRNELLAECGDRLVRVNDQAEIFDGIYACTIKSPDPDFACKDKKLKKKLPTGRLGADTFEHEIYLAIIENNTLSIISSCSHNGIVNIINDAQARFGMPVSSFIGGLHTRGSSAKGLNCSRKYLDTVIDKLNELSLKSIYTCHCTGGKAYGIFRQGLKFKIKYFSTGDTINI